MTLEMVAQRVQVLENQMKLLMSERPDGDDKTESKSKGKGKDKKEKIAKEDKPKRKPSGYNLFCKANRSDAVQSIIDEQNINEGVKPSNQDVMRKLGEMWKALDEEEQKEWKDKATSDEVDLEVE